MFFSFLGIYLALFITFAVTNGMRPTSQLPYIYVFIYSAVTLLIILNSIFHLLNKFEKCIKIFDVLIVVIITGGLIATIPSLNYNNVSTIIQFILITLLLVISLLTAIFLILLHADFDERKNINFYKALGILNSLAFIIEFVFVICLCIEFVKHGFNFYSFSMLCCFLIILFSNLLIGCYEAKYID